MFIHILGNSKVFFFCLLKKVACTCFWPPSVDLSVSVDADCAFFSTCGFFWLCGSSKCTFLSQFTLCSWVGGRKTRIKIGRFSDSEQLARCAQLRITLWSSALFFPILPVFDNSHSDFVRSSVAKMVQSGSYLHLLSTWMWILLAQCFSFIAFSTWKSYSFIRSFICSFLYFFLLFRIVYINLNLFFNTSSEESTILGDGVADRRLR